MRNEVFHFRARAENTGFNTLFKKIRQNPSRIFCRRLASSWLLKVDVVIFHVLQLGRPRIVHGVVGREDILCPALGADV